MASLVFISISRWGISWVSAAEPPATDAAPQRGSFQELVAAIVQCGAVVGWKARKQLDAISKREPSVSNWPVVELTGEPPQTTHDAIAVAQAYFSADKDLLPAGYRPSAEQWAVVNAAECGQNILCRAVAGAGKTTTLLLCAARASTQSHLLLTYNKRLQLDVARRARKNVAVMTYHAAAGKSYGITIRNDEQFRRFVRAAPENPLQFDVLLLDEAQDMSVEYYAFVRHLLRANPKARMIVVGDELQSINEYRGAYPEFLTDAPKLYSELAGNRQWTFCSLSVSRRLTPATAAFVNKHLYRKEVIVGGNTRDANRPPIYIAAAGKAGIIRALAAATKRAIDEFGHEGVYILAPSVRNLASKKSPIAELVRHHLTGVPLFIANDDSSQVSDSLVKGKLAILSFNSVKGCERQCVIIVGLDESYFQFYDRKWKNHIQLPNILSVAATRAISRLVVVAGTKDTLRSIDYESLAALAEVQGKPSRPKVHPPIPPKKQVVAVTKIVRHLHPETAKAAMELVARRTAVDELQRSCPQINGHVKFGSLTEDLFFIYGTLAPVLAEVARSGKSNFGIGLDHPEIVGSAEDIEPFSMQLTQKEYDAYPPVFWEHISAALSSKPADRSLIEWAVLAIARQAFYDGRHHIARQVTNYDWVNSEALIACRDIVMKALEQLSGEFEVSTPKVKIGFKTLVGIADFVEAPSSRNSQSSVVWEFKLGELCEEHELQLACYIALRGGGEGRLMSITCRETRSIYVDPEDALKFLTTLADRTQIEKRPIAEIIADFDAGLDTEFEQEDYQEAGQAEAWSLDDVF